jgi:hypothetical protein
MSAAGPAIGGVFRSRNGEAPPKIEALVFGVLVQMSGR